MFRLTPFAWISTFCFATGVLLGSLGVGFVTMTLSPVPLGANLVATSMAISPGVIAALVSAYVVPRLSRLLPPALFIAGLVVPVDFAFACLLGALTERSLQLTMACLITASMIWLAVMLEGRFSNTRVNNVFSVLIVKPTAHVSGVTLP